MWVLDRLRDMQNYEMGLDVQTQVLSELLPRNISSIIEFMDI